MPSRPKVFALALLMCGAPLCAADRSVPTPLIVQKLLDCRSITASEARLACFDAQIATVGIAVDKQELVIADQTQLKQARRSLFGLTLPQFALFGNKDDEDEKAEFTELETTIRSARRRADRNWIFILEDGARWAQTDTRTIAIDPKPGQTIKIRRAAMGSFLANVNKQVAIRIRREN